MPPGRPHSRRALLLAVSLMLAVGARAFRAPSHHGPVARGLRQPRLRTGAPPRHAMSEVDEKNLKAMTMFSNKYAQNTGTVYCSDPSIPAVVIKGLAEHKETLGAPLCPCRHYEDKHAEAKDGFWNCPCVPMRERHECHCMLFLKPDDDFAGESQEISLEEVAKLIATMD